MSTHLECDDLTLNRTRPSRMVISMCLKWLDRDRDCDSDGHHQWSIHHTSIAEAHRTIPNCLPELLHWYKENGGTEYDEDYVSGVTQFKPPLEELEMARQFIADAARLGLDVDIS